MEAGYYTVEYVGGRQLHALTVKVEDKAGNTNYSEAPLTVVIDTQIAIDGAELVNDSA